MRRDFRVFNSALKNFSRIFRGLLKCGDVIDLFVEGELRVSDQWKNSGLKRILLAATYSWAGLCAAWKNEAAFRQEVLLLGVLVPLGLWLGDDGVERALLIGSLLLVLMVELLNSAIEAVVDRFGTERHELSGRAKDLGSAAVLIALINVAVIWGLVLYDNFYS